MRNIKISKKTRARKNSVDIEKIVYQGIYDLFQNDRKMTFRKLATIFNGKRPDNISYMLKIRRLVLGEKALIDIQAIINICNYLQKPFEVVFKRR